jgi:hypothetical protein
MNPVVHATRLDDRHAVSGRRDLIGEEEFLYQA